MSRIRPSPPQAPVSANAAGGDRRMISAPEQVPAHPLPARGRPAPARQRDPSPAGRRQGPPTTRVRARELLATPDRLIENTIATWILLQELDEKEGGVGYRPVGGAGGVRLVKSDLFLLDPVVDVSAAL